MFMNEQRSQAAAADVATSYAVPNKCPTAPSCSSLCSHVWCAAVERVAAAEGGHDPSAAVARAATPREPHAGVAAQPAGPPFARAISHVRCEHLPHDSRKGTCEAPYIAGLAATRHDIVAMASQSDAPLYPLRELVGCTCSSGGFQSCHASHQWLGPCVFTAFVLARVPTSLVRA